MPRLRGSSISSPVSSSSSLRVEVEVNGVRVLVPCGDGSQPVSWLAQQAASRYAATSKAKSELVCLGLPSSGQNPRGKLCNQPAVALSSSPHHKRSSRAAAEMLLVMFALMQEGKTAVVVQELLTSSGEDIELVQDINNRCRWPDLSVSQRLSYSTSAARCHSVYCNNIAHTHLQCPACQVWEIHLDPSCRCFAINGRPNRGSGRQRASACRNCFS